MGVDTDKTDLAYPPRAVQACLDNLFVEAHSLEVASFRTDVVAGIKRLPPRERNVLVLHAAGYSFAEIGKRLGVSKTTVYNVRKQAFVLLIILLNPEVWKGVE